MSLIQFTENYEDLSTDRGYQFRFHCDRCHNGVMSSFQASIAGTAAGLFRAAGDVFGGVFSSAGNSAYDIQRAVGGKGHDQALRAAVDEVKPEFRQCRRCSKWVCQNCWNQKRGMCFNCAPDVQAELAAAQVEETIDQIKTGVKNVNFTKDLDLAGETVAICPQCGARVQGKFCAECGAQMAPKVKCPQCGAGADSDVKFCPECGGAMRAPAKPKCPGCGKEYEKAPKFCEDCGTRMPA
jgi:predicted amidophosphoribosyltransferase